jgi:hypothetical protein
MQQDTGAISKTDREKASIVISLFDAADAFGDAMKLAQCDDERELIAAQYRTRVAQVKDRLANMQTSNDEDGKFAESLERATSYLDDNIE